LALAGGGFEGGGLAAAGIATLSAATKMLAFKQWRRCLSMTNILQDWNGSGRDGPKDMLYLYINTK
jgi:hypothetical protein